MPTPIEPKPTREAEDRPAPGTDRRPEQRETTPGSHVSKRPPGRLPKR